MKTKEYYRVSIIRPKEVSIIQMAAYIRTAVTYWCKHQNKGDDPRHGLEAGDPARLIDESNSEIGVIPLPKEIRTINCGNCDKELQISRDNKKYCSRRCANTAHTRKARAKKLGKAIRTFKCPICRKIVHTAVDARQQYCTKKCRETARKLRFRYPFDSEFKEQ